MHIYMHMFKHILLYIYIYIYSTKKAYISITKICM